MKKLILSSILTFWSLLSLAATSDTTLEWKEKTSHALTYPYQVEADFTDNDDGTITLKNESDPVFANWDKSTGISITESQISDLQIYLTSETDPNFSAWDKSKTVIIKCIGESDALTQVDGIRYFTVPERLNGMALISANASVYTVSSSGDITIQINNNTTTYDILSTPITITAGYPDSYAGATPSVVDDNYKTVLTGNKLRIDVDGAGTDTKGLDIILVFN